MLCTLTALCLKPWQIACTLKLHGRFPNLHSHTTLQLESLKKVVVYWTGLWKGMNFGQTLKLTRKWDAVVSNLVFAVLTCVTCIISANAKIRGKNKAKSLAWKWNITSLNMRNFPYYLYHFPTPFLKCYSISHLTANFCLVINNVQVKKS